MGENIPLEGALMARFSTVAAALASTVSLVVLATPAEAQPRNFNIPAGPLKGALDAFVVQSGMQVIYKADELVAAHSEGVSGVLEPRDALNAVLRGSGFASVADKSGALAIVRSAVGNGSSGANSASSQGEDVVVVGTRIRGTAPVGSVVIVHGRDEIDRSGAGTVEEFLRQLPENHAASDPASAGFVNGNGGGLSQGGGNAFAGAAVNLHGLGPSATLVLVNGHRLAAAGVDGAFVDVSLLPLAAVESIQVLPDGASAIYGADAIAGVVNFQLKKDYDGAQSSLRVGGATRGGGGQFSASQLLGRSWSGGNALLAYEYNKQNGLLSNEREFTQNLGVPTHLVPTQKRHSVFAAGSQELGQDFRVFAEGYFSRRQFNQDIRSA
jgi:outer membrane cobalamin receptor